MFTAFLHAVDRKKIYRSSDALREAASRTLPLSSNQIRNATRGLVSVQGDSEKDREVVILMPRNSDSSVVLYVPGGGWVFPPRIFHWRFLAVLAHETNFSVHVALYPRAPTHTYNDVMGFLLPVYRELIVRAIPLIVMGDSAGGNIALSLLLRAREEGLPMPSRLVLMSPVVDLALSNPEMDQIEPRDPMLAIAGLRAAATWYAGNLSCEDGRVSALRGPLAHLPRTQLFIGTNEILFPDNQLFREKALREGVALDYHGAPEMMHVWPLMGFLPEARLARRQIAEFIES